MPREKKADKRPHLYDTIYMKLPKREKNIEIEDRSVITLDWDGRI